MDSANKNNEEKSYLGINQSKNDKNALKHKVNGPNSG